MHACMWLYASEVCDGSGGGTGGQVGTGLHGLAEAHVVPVGEERSRCWRVTAIVLESNGHGVGE
jgi:hypothetical protein